MYKDGKTANCSISEDGKSRVIVRAWDNEIVRIRELGTHQTSEGIFQELKEYGVGIVNKWITSSRT